MRALIKRLGYAQKRVVKECAEKYGSSKDVGGLASWLNGRNLDTPSVVTAGDAAMRWYEDNKDKESNREIKAEDIARVCVCIALYYRIGICEEINGAHTAPPCIVCFSF